MSERTFLYADSLVAFSSSRFGGMEVSDAGRLKALEEENRKLKKLPAETMLDASTLKEMLAKNF